MTSSLCLRVVAREDEGLLFVRLSQRLVSELRAAIQADEVEHDPLCGWSVSEADSSFLPLVVLVDGQEIYTSHNGGLLDRSDGKCIFAVSCMKPLPMRDSVWNICHYHRIYSVEI